MNYDITQIQQSMTIEKSVSHDKITFLFLYHLTELMKFNKSYFDISAIPLQHY